jgi:hypothetical protein
MNLGAWKKYAPSSRQKIEESISILNFFPPKNRGDDFYFEFFPAKIEETISILNDFQQ